jgi:hypothetical protein
MWRGVSLSTFLNEFDINIFYECLVGCSHALHSTHLLCHSTQSEWEFVFCDYFSLLFSYSHIHSLKWLHIIYLFILLLMMSQLDFVLSHTSLKNAISLNQFEVILAKPNILSKGNNFYLFCYKQTNEKRERIYIYENDEKRWRQQ